MREERPTIDAPGGPLPAHLATADGWPRGPAVVVVQEWWGVDAHIHDVARRFAAEGFTALAPDLYRGRQAGEPDDARKLAMELDWSDSLAGLRSSVGWLLDHGATAVGAVGFCMGGSLVWALAHEDERLSAAVPFYGASAGEGGELRCPLMAHFGQSDHSIPPEKIERIRAHLSGQRYAHRIFVYEGAGHAFFNDTRASYRPDAAALAWERTLEFLRNELGAFDRVGDAG
jgi:carboxymethylenebutenolidase